MMHRMDLYVRACMAVLHTNSGLPDKECLQSIVFLRQSLTCCVCGGLLRDPIGPNHTVCPHHICSDCRGGTMTLKPSCSWCKNHMEFTRNKQLELMVQCFHRLCCYISTLPFWHNSVALNTDLLSRTFVCDVRNGLAIIDSDNTLNDGSNFKEIHQIDYNSDVDCGSSSNNVFDLVTVEDDHINNNDDDENTVSSSMQFSKKRLLKECKGYMKRNKKGKHGPTYSLSIDDKTSDEVKKDVENLQSHAQYDQTIMKKLSWDESNRKRTYCRCGTIRGTMKLLCDLVMCPCYAHNFSCNDDCHCSLCKNPHGRRNLKQLAQRKIPPLEFI